MNFAECHQASMSMLSCLLYDMRRFAMFVHGLSLMLQSTIYDGLIDNEYDDEMRAVVHAYNECCQTHMIPRCLTHAPTDGVEPLRPRPAASPLRR